MKKITSVKLLALCFMVTFLLTNCQKDSSKTAETEEAAAMDSSLDGTENMASEVKSPEEIAMEEIAGMATTTIKWEKLEHDFGDIKKGEVQKTSFKFTNTGNAPLVIASAKAGCGCTVPKKPEEPIMPGKTGEIEVEYNGSGAGAVTKFVDVVLNTETKTEKLTIKTNVIVPEGEAAGQ
jgi:hypothetical protein